jgi:glycosyltransferase involved in cell wall biosynthesis
MKILQINNIAFKKGGAEAVFLNTVDVLRKNGHTVFTLSLDNDFADENEAFSIDSKNVFHNNFYSWHAKKTIEKVINKTNPDVIHIHSIIGGITYSIFQVVKKYNIPVVATIHDFRLLCPTYVFLNSKNEICEKCKGKKYYNCLLNNCSPRGRVRSAMLALESYFRDFFYPFTKLIDAFIFVSDFSRNKFCGVYPDLAKKSALICNFTNEFEKNEAKGSYFLFFGRLIKIKGLMTLLKAFKKMPEQNMIIVGNGELYDVVEKNKTPNIIMAGFKEGEELKKYIKESSFVLLTSECYETNSMVVIESFAMGKPVIASRIGAVPELVTENKNGYLFRPGDVDDLISKIQKAASMDDDNYKTFSKSAYNESLGRFSPEKYYSDLIRLYEKVISSKKAANV